MWDRQRVVALRDAELGKILPLGAIGVHIVLGDECKRRVGAARPIRIDRVLGKTRERRQRLAERVHMIGIRAYADHDARITGLHSQRRPPKRHDTARPAEGNVVEPTWRQAEVLCKADTSVWA